MNDKHGPHRTAGVVEDPFLGVLEVGRDGMRMAFGKLINDRLDDVGRVGLAARCELVGMSDGTETCGL